VNGKKAQCVLDYHEKTKHLPERYAPSPGFMDWATEPNPYRLYDGAEDITLPLLKVDPACGYEGLFVRSEKARPFNTENISAFLELGVGLSAIKSFMGSTWALRMNPSSGNLHPTEAYIITLDESPSRGVFHYRPQKHALEKRAALGEALTEKIKNTFKADGFITCLTSIDWREAWKYGSRAFRYSSIDTGHALGSMSFSAALLGWSITPLYTLSDEDTGDMLGFNGTKWTPDEEERVEGAFFVHKAAVKAEDSNIGEDILKAFRAMSLCGRPNSLSADHVQWPIIEEVTKCTEKERQKYEPSPPLRPHKLLVDNCTELTGAEVIRKRRSAQAFNPKAGATKESFFSIIDKTIPTPACAPFDALNGKPQLNLLIFIHRVEGFQKGLYMLMRNNDDTRELKEHMRDGFLWEPSGYEGLYLLMEGDLTDEARFISCQQDIAGEGVFSASMLARFRENIEQNPSSYRDLFIEAGMIGQVLYLTAEAVGLRGTGIGCFYDDLLHEFAGFKQGDNTFQSLYHFTVGAPIVDARITTEPPYRRLREKPS